MGFSWSLHLCQSVVRHALSKVLSDDEVIEDGKAGVHLPFEDSKCGAAYVDNICVGGYDKAFVDSILKQVTNHLSFIGFAVHEFEWASPRAEFVGLQLDSGIFS
eukprot:6012029-Karenia_brevis.AAC.1